MKKSQSGVSLVQGGWFSWWSQRERRKRTKVKGKKNKSKGEEEPKHLNLSLILQGEAMNEIWII
jgi:hypothetical protein